MEKNSEKIVIDEPTSRIQEESNPVENRPTSAQMAVRTNKVAPMATEVNVVTVQPTHVEPERMWSTQLTEQWCLWWYVNCCSCFALYDVAENLGKIVKIINFCNCFF